MRLKMAVAMAIVAGACGGRTPATVATVPGLKAFVGATLIDGTGRAPTADAVLVVRDGLVEAAGPRGAVTLPEGAETIDVAGRWIVPGLVNAHGHVGDTSELESGPQFYTRENLERQLRLYARYGVTSVLSLGGDGPEGFRLRDAQGVPQLDRARLYLAGPVIAADDPEHAQAAVDAAADLNPDYIKIRVDDNLGTTPKMPPEVYRAVIGQARARNLRVAAHVYYLDDARGLVSAGIDLLAHSVRDRDVDADLIARMKARDVCLSPTLMREVSTFVYESRPAFFGDPFFRREADEAVLARLEEPGRQAQVAASRSAQQYKKGLEVARRNARALADAGIRLASGTDTGPPARFQGYFEHLELEQLVEAGLTPMAALLAATRDAAACVGLGDRAGQLRPGYDADLLVLTGSPLADIRQTRALESVWIAGNRVPGRD